jgi:hypothetical protein
MEEEEEEQTIHEEEHEEDAQAEQPEQKEASPAMFVDFDTFTDYAEDAKQATRQIDADIEEAQRALKANGADPRQLLQEGQGELAQRGSSHPPSTLLR